MDHLFSLDLGHQSDTGKRLSGLFRKWFRAGLKDAEGVILPGFSSLFLSNCRKEKISVPDDLAVTVIGTDDKPQRNVFFLDNNLVGHFQYAFELLENASNQTGSNRVPGISASPWVFACPLNRSGRKLKNEGWETVFRLPLILERA